MKALILSEDKTIFGNNSLSQKRIVEYSALVNMLFVVVAGGLRKDSKNDSAGQHLIEKIWLYQTKDNPFILKVFDLYKLASFQIKNKGVFHADIIICEDQPVSTLAGYLLAKKYKRPLYINISEANHRNYFSGNKHHNFLISKLLNIVLKKADCVKVDSDSIKKHLSKSLPESKIEVIKPFVDIKTLIADYKSVSGDSNEKKKEIIRSRFGLIRFTVVTFVNSINEARIAIDILRKINMFSSQISLFLIHSENISHNEILSQINDDVKSFIYVEDLNNNIVDYLISSNLFWGISSGEKYEETFVKACVAQSAIIAKRDSFTEEFIDDGTTGFLCPASTNEELINYMADRHIYLMRNYNIAVGFKINIGLTFKQQFGNTNVKEEYLQTLQLSWQKCIEEYKKAHTKLYY